MNVPNTQPTGRGKIFGKELEIVISTLLRAGVLLSMAIIAVGLALLVRSTSVSGTGERLDMAGLLSYGPGAPPFPATIPAVLRGAVALDPLAVILLGAAVLVLTPVLRVAVSLAAFVLERDYIFAAITLFVLMVMALSLVVGGAA